MNLRRRLLRIDPDEASFRARGFSITFPSTVRHLERIGETFIWGYTSALDATKAEELVKRLEAKSDDLRGFAFEGAAMGLAVLDCLSLRRSRRLSDFMDLANEQHTYMIHVGAGWAMARLPNRRKVIERQLDSMLRPLAYDGYGFHSAYFHPRRYVWRDGRVRWIRDLEAKSFDQGVGRALWFVNGASAPLVAATVDRFHSARKHDIWSGVGLAATYAGGVASSTLSTLVARARGYEAALAQGAAFAAKARLRAGTVTPQTDRACLIFCDMGAADAARITDELLATIAGSDAEAYHEWQEAIRDRFRAGDTIGSGSAV